MAVMDGDSIVESTLRLPGPLHSWLKHRAVDERTSMNSIVVGLIMVEQARVQAEAGKAA